MKTEKQTFWGIAKFPVRLRCALVASAKRKNMTVTELLIKIVTNYLLKEGEYK